MFLKTQAKKESLYVDILENKEELLGKVAVRTVWQKR